LKNLNRILIIVGLVLLVCGFMGVYAVKINTNTTSNPKVKSNVINIKTKDNKLDSLIKEIIKNCNNLSNRIKKIFTTNSHDSTDVRNKKGNMIIIDLENNTTTENNITKPLNAVNIPVGNNSTGNNVDNNVDNNVGSNVGNNSTGNNSTSNSTNISITYRDGKMGEWGISTIGSRKKANIEGMVFDPDDYGHRSFSSLAFVAAYQVVSAESNEVTLDNTKSKMTVTSDNEYVKIPIGTRYVTFYATSDGTYPNDNENLMCVAIPTNQAATPNDNSTVLSGAMYKVYGGTTFDGTTCQHNCICKAYLSKWQYNREIKQWVETERTFFDHGYVNV